jgi:hypothetical protein
LNLRVYHKGFSPKERGEGDRKQICTNAFPAHLPSCGEWWHKNYRANLSCLERFILPVCVAIASVLAVTNPMNFDVTQRVTAGLALIFLAYFVSHTVLLHHQAGKNTASNATSIVAEKAIDKAAPSTDSKSEPSPEHKQPHATPRHKPPVPAKPMVSLTDGQRLVLMNRLGQFSGNTVRLVRVGSEPQANIVFAQLDNIFEQAGWKRQKAEIGTVASGAGAV